MKLPGFSSRMRKLGEVILTDNPLEIRMCAHTGDPAKNKTEILALVNFIF